MRPEALRHLTRNQARTLGERFLSEASRYRRLGRPFFIDKMPNNFWHIGLIHIILPRSTIIDVRREPMACCFSNFKQLFANGQEFTYSVEDIARYYRTYLDVMRHWDAVLPGRVLRIQHEDLIDDLEGNVRRILAHCGLPFEPGCLEFHKTRREPERPKPLGNGDADFAGELAGDGNAGAQQVERRRFHALDRGKHLHAFLGQAHAMHVAQEHGDAGLLLEIADPPAHRVDGKGEPLRRRAEASAARYLQENARRVPVRQTAESDATAFRFRKRRRSLRCSL